MSLFDFPWSVVVVFLVLLSMLLLREVRLTLRLHRSHPERGMAWFNSFVLLALLLGMLCGGAVMLIHVSQLARIVPLYPHARYAPERELGSQKNNWILVTPDTNQMIKDYYAQTLPQLGYVVTIDDHNQTMRMLFQKGATKLYLTIVPLEDTRVLYYGTAGEMSIVENP